MKKGRSGSTAGTGRKGRNGRRTTTEFSFATLLYLLLLALSFSALKQAHIGVALIGEDAARVKPKAKPAPPKVPTTWAEIKEVCLASACVRVGRRGYSVCTTMALCAHISFFLFVLFE